MPQGHSCGGLLSSEIRTLSAGHFIQGSPVYKLIGITLQQSWGNDRQGLLPCFVDEKAKGFTDFPKSHVHVQFMVKLSKIQSQG